MERTDTEKLLDSMIDHIHKDQHIDDLMRENERLRAENALLRARLDIMTLRRMKAMRDYTIPSALPTFASRLQQQKGSR